MTVALSALLVLASIGTGVALNLAGSGVQADTPPLYALWRPHVGPGTPAALAVAAAVILHGPRLADTLSWRRLLVSGYLAAVGWIFALAMVDGWQRGLAERLVQRAEYLWEVPGVTDIGVMLREFTSRILDFQPESWTTHVAGHPPGALLVFVWLDRIGLGGGGAAAVVCVLAGAAVTVTIPVTLRALRAEQAARAAVPFLVLLPGAIWLGASADAIFTAVTSTGIALLALALTTSRRPAAPALAAAAGTVLTFACFLSYGLILMAPIALAVTIAATATARSDNSVRVDASEGRRSVDSYGVVAGVVWRLGWALGGGVLVVVGFAAAGFWWFDGYELVVERYYQGIAADRPYRYWVWANLACLLITAGPAAAVIVRRAAAGLTFRRGTDHAAGESLLRDPVHLLTLGAAVAIVGADLSGLSKAEVERIWLPFAVWLLAGASLLPRRSVPGYLIAAATIAVLINHLLLTIW